jgi:sigma-B regulation protein RsbU (phosphoserine phosphatase)
LKTGLWTAAAAVLGCALLVYAVPRAHPAASWNVRLDRQQSIVRAQEVSVGFGFHTSDWDVTAAGGSQNKPNSYYALHPADTSARRFSPVYPEILLRAPGRPYRITTELSARGDVNKWERFGYPKSPVPDTARARQTAENALAQVAGADLIAFRPVTDASPTKGALLFAWERPGGLTQRFEATVAGDGLLKAQLTPVFSRDFEDRLQARKHFREQFIVVVAIVLYALGTVLAAIVYLYWAVRRAVKYRFILSLLGVLFAWAIVTWLNWNVFDETYSNVSNGESVMSVWGEAALLLAMLAVFFFILCAAMDAVGAGAKLVTLRSVFSSSLLNRRAGYSALAGLVCGPLLVALPLWIASWRLFGSVQTGDSDASIVYSVFPTLQALNSMMNPAIIGLFGFGAGFLAYYVRKRWLANSILSLAGILLFTTLTVPSESSAVAILLSGALTFLIYYQIYLRFDVLATLVAAWSAHAVWNSTALLLQPARSLEVSGITALIVLAGLAGCAALLAWRGRGLAIAEAGPAVATSQREALMAEFSIAHRVQQQMLPARPPEIPGCSIAASCQPAREVGGDLFDFLKLPDGRWSISVGDVSGKGVPAALYMTLTKGLLIATTQDSNDLLDIITHVNRHIFDVTERRTFVTMALGAFDPETRTFDHVRAGHNPIVWRRPAENATSLLNAPGIGLGIVSDRLFLRSMRLESMQLEAGDALVFYSDGLTEAMNAEDEQFGEDRLMRAVEEMDGVDATQTREHILSQVRTFLNGIPAQDDMTLVVLRVN